MRYLLLFFIGSSFLFKSYAQRRCSILNIKLPPAIAYYDNQFSGMYIHDGALYLMSECRLQEDREALLYSIQLKDLDHYRIDTNFVLPYQKHPIIGLDILRRRILQQQQKYEGLEAMVINGNSIYFSVETDTPSDYCYLLKGKLVRGEVIMDSSKLLPLRKPTKQDGTHIYNAGFESIALYKQKIYVFFEYNYFDKDNHSYRCDTILSTEVDAIKLHPKLPFRMTDITQASKQRFVAINYFYKGTGPDTVYRIPANDKNNSLIKDSTGYKNHIRLIAVKINKKKISWKPLLDLPTAFMSHNWEGIAVYKKGFFLINDKYTPTKPYSSVLIYLER